MQLSPLAPTRRQMTVKETLYLTPQSAYQTFQEGHLGFVVPQGVVMLNEPHKLDSCVLLTPMQQTAWQGHAQSEEALELIQQTEGFALIKRFGIKNPYEDIDFSQFDGTLTIPQCSRDIDLESIPEQLLERAEGEVTAFMGGKLGYRTQGGVLRMIEGETVILEREGSVVWAGSLDEDYAITLIEHHDGTVALSSPPMKTLQA